MMADIIECKKLVTCQICVEMLVLPRMFPCQHDICLNCLAEFARSKVVSVDEQGFLALTEEAQEIEGQPTFKLNCPTCDKQFTFTQANKVDKSIKSTQILDIINKGGKKSQQKCKICSEKEQFVEFECVDCDKKFCKTCFYEGKCQSKSHFVGKLIDSEIFSCLHHDVKIKYLCIDCGIPICFDCYLQLHWIHKVKDISFIKEELRKSLKTSKLIIAGNNDDTDQLEKEIANIEAEDDLKRWKSMASEVFDGLIEDVHKEEEEDLVQKLRSIRIDAGTLSKKIQNVSDKEKNCKGGYPKILRLKPEIEKTLGQCHEQEEKISSLKTDVSQRKSEAASFMTGLKDKFLTKISSLIEEDIKSQCKHLEQGLQASSEQALQQSKQEVQSSPVQESDEPFKKPSVTPKDNVLTAHASPSSPYSTAVTPPCSASTVALNTPPFFSAPSTPRSSTQAFVQMPHTVPRPSSSYVPNARPTFVQRGRAFMPYIPNVQYSTAVTPGSSTPDPTARAATATRPSGPYVPNARSLRHAIQDVINQPPAAHGGTDSSQAEKHRSCRHEQHRSVSQPAQLSQLGIVPSSLEHSHSEKNLPKPSNRGLPVRIRDPNQGGKDVTDEILKSRRSDNK